MCCLKTIQACLLAGILLMSAFNLPAQRFWTGSSTNWNDPQAWSACADCPEGAGIPDAQSQVIFPIGGTIVIGPEGADCEQLIIPEGVELTVLGGPLSIYGDAILGSQANLQNEALVFQAAGCKINAPIRLDCDLRILQGAGLQLLSNLYLPDNKLAVYSGGLDAAGFGIALKDFECPNAHSQLLLEGAKIVVAETALVHPAVQAEESEATLWPLEGATIQEGPLTVAWNRDATCGTGPGQTPFTISASVASDYNGEAISCNGADDGVATVSVTGGSGNFAFQWVGGMAPVFTQNYPGLGAGTYTVLVTDLVQGITCVDNVQIAEPAPIAVFDFIDTPPSCAGECDGTATSITIGGVPPYNYLWGNGETTQSANALCEGPVSLTITDLNGCVFTTTYTVELEEILPNLTLNDVLCNGAATGSASVSPTGGDGGPYTVTWSTGDTGPNLSNLPAGSYSVTVADAGGCEVSSNFVIAENPPIAVSIDDVLEPLCSGLADGSIAVSASGGDEPYDFAWTGPNGFIGNGANINNLLAGDYTLTLTDANGCEATAVISVNEPDALLIDASITPLLCSGESNGGIAVTIAGGSPVYQFAWSGPNGFTSNSQNISGLEEGTYSLTVTDANNCEAIQSFEITTPDPIVALENITEPSCNGLSNGSIALNLSGGTPGYTVAWNGPNGYTGFGTIIGGLAAGTYSATISDDAGCQLFADYTLSEPEPITIDLDLEPVSCNGFNDGSITTLVSGGTEAYSFGWTGPNGFSSADQNLNNLEPGTYTLLLTDAEGCQQSANALINEPDPLVLVPIVSDVSCGGESDGAIDLSILGGTPPYTINWSGPNGFTSSNEDIAGLPAGTYNLLVSDLEACTTNASYEVSELPELELTLTPTDLSCNGTDDGSIELSISGGQGPYQVNWAGPNLFISNDQNINNLEAGFYNVLVVDANNCFTEDAVSINEPALLDASFTLTDPSCNGEADGSIEVTVSGGTPPYTFAWSNGAVDQDLFGLPAGTYTLTITDDAACTFDSPPLELHEASPIDVLVTSNNLDCGLPGTGSISLTISGGVPNYTVSWTGPDGFTGAGTSLSNLNEGSYTATIVDAAACEETVVVSIDNPDPLTVNGTISPLLCADELAAIDLTISGGTPPYDIVWVGPQGFTSSDEDLSNLTQGIYEVQISDAQGCVVLETFDASAPDPLLVSADVQALDCSGDPNGSIVLTITGGTPPYTINWTGSGFNSTEPAIFDLEAGIYTVVVEDANGCSNTSAYNLSEPDALQIDLTENAPGCNDSNDGSLEALVSGGVAPYSYLWSGPNGFTSTAPSIANLEPGSYTLNVSDSGTCSEEVVLTLTPPDPIVLDATVTNVVCNGENSGAIELTISGGTPGFNAVWSGPNAFASSDLNISNLQAGNYLVEVQDANGCLADASFLISESDPIVVDLLTSPSTCNESNGSASATASGGSGDLVLTWLDGGGNALSVGDAVDNLPAGPYTLLVIDGNGCTLETDFAISDSDAITLDATVSDVLCPGDANGTIDLSIAGATGAVDIAWIGPNGFVSTEEDLADLTAGTYSVSVSDETNCFAALTVEIMEAAPLQVSFDAIAVSCDAEDNGSINALATGGAEPYLFAWVGPNGFTSTNSFIENLEPGTYTLTLSDSNLCSFEASFDLLQDEVLELSFVTQDAGCNGASNGSIATTLLSGVEPLTVLWSGPNSYSSTELSPSGLAAGTYTLSASDANGCSFDAEVEIVEDAPLVLTVDLTEPDCQTENGSLLASATGGSGSFFYAWYDLDNGNALLSNDPLLTGLGSGNYFIEVIDANGCAVDQTVALSENEGDLGVAVVEPLCAGDNNGAIDLTIEGDNGPYDIIWSGPNGFSAGTEDISDLVAGSYNVEVVDALGCTLLANVELMEPEILTAGINVTDVSCFGDDNGEVEVFSTGGTGALSIEWTDANGFVSDQEMVDGLSPSCLTVTVTDENLCQAISTACVEGPEELIVEADIENVFCSGAGEGSIAVTVSGGFTPYTYSWIGPDGFTSDSDVLSELIPGVYELLLIDGNLCERTALFEVQETNGVEADLLAIDPLCQGASNGSFELLPSTGASPFEVEWYAAGDLVGEDLFIGGLPAGSYTYVLTDSNGCVLEGEAELVDAELLEVIVDVVGIACANGANGSMFASVQGGSAPYSFVWSGPNGFTGNGELISGLSPGSYGLTVTDANGCETTATSNLENPIPLSIDILSIQAVACLGDENGSIEVAASGGTPEYTYTWSGSDGFTADGAAVNNLPSGNYSLVVSDANGCTQSLASVPLPFSGDLSVQADEDLSACWGDAAFVTGSNTTDQGGAWYTLEGGLVAEGDTLIVDFEPGNYTLVYTANDNACVRTDTLELTVFDLPAVDAGNDQEIYPEEEAVLGGSPTAASEDFLIVWEPSEFLEGDDVANPRTLPMLQSTQFFVEVTDLNGCTARDSAWVYIIPELDVPSGFTPNDDGMNDLWVLGNTDLYPSIVVEIYNRWGELLFRDDRGYGRPWDGNYNGNPVPVGTYYYVIEINEPDFQASMTGPLTILR